MKLKYRSSK